MMNANTRQRFWSHPMNILSIYIEAFYRHIRPNDHSHIYFGVNNESIARYKHNVVTHPGPCNITTTHIFMMPTLKHPDDEFLMYTFAKGIDFGRILTAVRLPHNHQVVILYILDHALALNHLIGDDYVIYTTIDNINTTLKHLPAISPNWLNNVYNQKCIIGPLTKDRVVYHLYLDTSITHIQRAEYYHDMSKFTTFTTNLLNTTSEFDNSLTHQLAELASARERPNPTTIHTFGDLNVTEDSINLMMNIDKVCYKVLAAGEIAKATPTIDTLAHLINSIVDGL